VGLLIVLCSVHSNVIFTSHSTSTPSAFEDFFTADALYKLLTYLLQESGTRKVYHELVFLYQNFAASIVLHAREKLRQERMTSF